MLTHFAVVGNPIGHSLSPVIHQHFAQQMNMTIHYERIQGDVVLFEEQIAYFFQQHGKGLNITLPFKQRAFVMAPLTTERCKKAGAANTLWMEEGCLWADNTDGIGFIRDVTRYLSLTNKKILILGTGGVARGIISPLMELNPAQLVVAYRNHEKAQQLQRDFSGIECNDLQHLSGSFDLIINATSAHLEGADIALPKKLMEQHPICYDLSYQLNQDTSFIRHARSFAATAVDGLGMLVEQAAESFYIWNKVRPETSSVLNYLRGSTKKI